MQILPFSDLFGPPAVQASLRNHPVCGLGMAKLVLELTGLAGLLGWLGVLYCLAALAAAGVAV